MVTVNAEQVSYSYGDSRGIQGVSFTLPEGENLAVLGANGAGKTTLLLCIAGLLKFRGDVTVNHLNVRDRGEEVRRMMGFVFQDPDDQIFMPTVFEDVAFTLRLRGANDEEIKKKVSDVLSMLGMKGFEEREPHHLSYGEKRKVCVAGAIVHSPLLLLLDEPTAGLDPRSRRELGEILNRLDSTLIIATHDVEFAKSLCGRALVLSEGRKMFEGSMKSLFERSDILTAAGLL